MRATIARRRLGNRSCLWHIARAHLAVTGVHTAAQETPSRAWSTRQLLTTTATRTQMDRLLGLQDIGIGATVDACMHCRARKAASHRETLAAHLVDGTQGARRVPCLVKMRFELIPPHDTTLEWCQGKGYGKRHRPYHLQSPRFVHLRCLGTATPLLRYKLARI